MKIDWINSWRKGNKKETIYDISIRLGRLTILELYCNPKVEHRFMILNFGFELCVCEGKKCETIKDCEK